MSFFISFIEVSQVLRKPLKFSLILTGVITLISSSAVFFVQPQIPIFYSLPLTSQQLANRNWILLFPALSFIVTICHMLLISIFRRVDDEVLRIFCWFTVALQLLLLVILFRLLLLVL